MKILKYLFMMNFVLGSVHVHASNQKLRSLLRASLEHNSTTKETKKLYEAAGHSKSLTTGKFFPSVSAYAKTIFYDDLYTSQIGANHDVAFGAKLTQTVFDMTLIREVGLKSSLRDTAQAEFSGSQQDLIRLVSGFYFDLVQSQQLLKLFEELAENARKHMKATMTRFRSGAVKSIPYHQAKYRLELRQNDVKRNHLRLLQLQKRLHSLTGVLVDQELSIPEVAVAPENFLKLPFEKHPQLFALSQTVNSRKQQTRFERGRHWPTLSLVGSIERTKDDTLSKFQNEWRITAELSFPLFSGGQTSSRVDEAHKIQKAFEYKYQQRRQEAESEFDTTLETVKTNETMLKSMTTARNYSKRALKNTLRSFRAGTASNFEVIQAQNEFILIERQYIELKMGFERAKVDLLWMTGQLKPEKVENVFRD